jgi:aryl-alcohol dehydrogenase-like predicted oxidoreductase
VEDSLRRLQTDWIDLYQVHRPDPKTDIEETLGALTDLVHAGKIRAFGCSTFPAEHIVEAWHVAENRGSGPSSRLTPSSGAASNVRCCRPRGGSTWACSPGVRSRGVF